MSAPRPRPTADHWREHVAIGKAALRRGWIQFEDFCARLQGLGEEARAVTPEGFWIESGMLRDEQLTSLILESEARDEQLDTIGPDATLIFQPPARPGGTPATGEGSRLSRAQTGPQQAVQVDSSDFPTQMFDGGRSARPLAPVESGERWFTSLVLEGFEALEQMRDRYELHAEVGRGGSGRVFRAHDRALGRVVAMKVLRAPDEGPTPRGRIERFVQEARATGRLEHPNIIPIYDVGVLATGEVYYTMKFVRRHSLREVIRQLAAHDETMRREYSSLTELLQIFLPVCQAVHYAHDQGIVHRDLKPDNIMLGDYGEVLVTDWGLARLLEEPAEEFSRTRSGLQTLGTPAYMPPEQAQGLLSEVDELSDIYSLGAILYEVLTLQPPFEGPSPQSVIEQVALGRIIPPRRRAPGRHVPQDLEALCLRAMSRDRSRRFATARELHDAVVRFLDGVQHREAERKLYMGRSAGREYFASLEESAHLAEEVRRLSARLEAWQPPERKRSLWRLEDSLQRARARMARAYSDAVRAYTQALAHDAGNEAARQELARLYWSRFEVAEADKNVHDQIHFEALVRQFDVQAEFVRQLEGDGALTLTSDPPGARVTLYLYREFDRVMTACEPRLLGETPVHLERLQMGRYLAVFEAPDHVTTRYPIQITRSLHWEGHVRMLREAARHEGFIHIPAGAFVFGGDAQAPDAAPEARVELDDFLIARHPVTFAEYLTFLDALEAVDPAEARRRAPRARSGDGELAEVYQGRWMPMEEILIEGEARQRYPQGEGHEWRLPVLCVSVEDALAYIDWRSRVEGRRYRLPHVKEWEKAARGVDGRLFPWGDTFDATFCKMHWSRPEASQPEPIDVFERDESPYGVRDMAGLIQEWCRDESWRLPRSAPPLPGALPDEHPPEICVVKGGSWNEYEPACHAAARLHVLSVGRASGVGFRLACEMPWAGDDEA